MQIAQQICCITRFTAFSTVVNRTSTFNQFKKRNIFLFSSLCKQIFKARWVLFLCTSNLMFKSFTLVPFLYEMVNCIVW